MKRKKGFTLIELLGIIVILAMILLLIIPMIDNSLQNKKEELYTTQIENISLALKNWGAENMFNLPNEEGGSITVTLGQLKQAGFIDENLNNPITGDCFPNDMLLTITKNGNSYDYEVLADSGSATCNEKLNYSAPIIGLKGKTIIYVEVNTTYEEPGLIVTKSDGTPIAMSQVKQTVSGPKNFIDTATLGTYQISYSITDNGNTSSIIRTVIVRDTISPILTFEKTTYISSVGGSFDILNGVIATDNSGKKPTLSSEGTVNTNVSGTYEIKYTAIDGSGNKTTDTRKVVVNDQTAPTINVAIVGNPFNENGWSNADVNVKITANDISSGIDRVYTCISNNGKCTPSTATKNSSLTVTLSEATANGYVCAYATDAAGNKSETACTSTVIKIDKIAPTCKTNALTGTIGNNSWYTTPVSITGTCSDPNGSGCVETTISNTYGSNTSGTTLSPGTVVDKAGNSTKCDNSNTFKIDMTAPTCTTVVNGTINSRGWYQVKSLPLTGQCNDSGSGCVGNTSTTVGEGKGYYAPPTITDNAGNTATCPSTYLQVDATAPVFGHTTTIPNPNTDDPYPVIHLTKFYDAISVFEEMNYEFWWCYGDAAKCSGSQAGSHFQQGATNPNGGFVGYYDRQHVVNSSPGAFGTLWFTWHATDAAGNETWSCRYYTQWSNYTSGGYSTCY